MSSVHAPAAWLAIVEAGLVARALGQVPPPTGAPLAPEEALAGYAAIAAKFLAVSTPRTFGLAGCGDLAPRVLAAQRAYAAPRELRIFEAIPVDAARVADEVQGRVTSLAEACACDIVVLRGKISVRREWVRNGTLVTALDEHVVFAPDLLAVAAVYGAHAPAGVRLTASLDAVAAGLVDGRVLDEITVCLPP